MYRHKVEKIYSPSATVCDEGAISCGRDDRLGFKVRRTAVQARQLPPSRASSRVPNPGSHAFGRASRRRSRGLVEAKYPNSDKRAGRSNEELLRTELQREQDYVDLCYRLLEDQRLRAETQLRSSIDLPVNTPQSVFEREVFASYSRKRLQAVSGSEHQLVFGRLDLEGEDDPVYVGRIGLSGKDQRRVLVDWRAPVGSSFYRATAAEPRGVVRRRTLVTRGRRVVDLNDDLLIPDKAGGLEVVAGEGALMQALLRERGEFMPDIVATIQAEQDEVIRFDPRVNILLTGGPGTGKSVVALHRTAYLMYERAAELERRGVLVLGPGRRFSRYISRVLPSLGETSVNIRSVFDLTEPVVATGREPLRVGRMKGAGEMAKALKKYLIDTYPPPGGDVRINLGSRFVRVDTAELDTMRRRVLSSKVTRLNSAGGLFWTALANAASKLGGRRHPGRAEVAALASALRDRSDLEELVESMFPPRRAVEVWREMGAHPTALRRALAAHVPSADVECLVRDLAGEEVRVGDVALIDELEWLLGPVEKDAMTSREEPGYEEISTIQDRLDASRQKAFSSLKTTGYGHIVVDEAQDLTPMQWRMLLRRGEDATWTVVGDPSQTTLATPGSMEDAAERLIRPQPRRFSLAINYRTPREILQYASRASGLSLDHIHSIRSGTPPVYFPSSEQLIPGLDQAARWLRDHRGSGCFIAVDPRDGELVDGRVDEFEVIWALDAKGLEWDNVVLVRPEAMDPRIDSDASLILIGATRATKRLAVVTATSGVQPQSLGPPLSG